MEELWYHVDVNSAFLSWSAANEIWIKGGDLDLRTVPSVIGGHEKDRHGIVLAKSGPAARFGIRTGETLVEARNKCPGLIIAPPEYDLYVQCSRALIQLLGRYSHHIHQYSIDEDRIRRRPPGTTSKGLGAHTDSGALEGYHHISMNLSRFLSWQTHY